MKKGLKRILQIAIMLFVFIILSYSCKKDSNNNTLTTGPIAGPNVTDIDGNIYHSVVIGTQTWTVENLKVTHYRNGDAIPNAIDIVSWGSTTGAYCNYNNDANNATTYGKLYNWYTVVDTRNLCPTGWHVPSDTEWTTLITYLGGDSIAGGKLKETGLTHWASPNATATNVTGFTALPAGDRYFEGSYFDIGNKGYWWSSTEQNSTYAWSRFMYYNYSNATRYGNSKASGMSVRCLKN